MDPLSSRSPSPCPVAMKKLTSVLLLLPLLAPGGEAYKVLAWLPSGSKSHIQPVKPLALELAKRGHEVTFIAPAFDPELAEAELKFLYRPDEMKVSFQLFRRGSFLLTAMTEVVDRVVDGGLFVRGHEQWPAILATDWDVVLLSPLADQSIYYAKRVWNTSAILFHPGVKMPLVDKLAGNPYSPAYVVNDLLPLDPAMGFVERVKSALGFAVSFAISRFVFTKGVNSRLSEALHLPDMDLYELHFEVDMVFYNDHYLMERMDPVAPNTVFVGGIHCGPGRPLDTEVEDWVAGAEKGIVLLSFGSVIPVSEMPEENLQSFLGAFQKLAARGYRVIMKWELDTWPENKPDNVMLMKWIPQQDVLAHPNTKAFITHSGMMGTQEAIYHNVPMVAMPVVNDEFSIAARIERLGLGIQLQWDDLDEESLSRSLETVLSDANMTSTMTAFSDILRNDLTSPLERAVYWVEHLAKHRNAPHMRLPYRRMPFWQSALLDVFAAAFVAVSTVIALFLGLCRCLCKRRGRSKVKTS